MRPKGGGDVTALLTLINLVCKVKNVRFHLDIGLFVDFQTRMINLLLFVIRTERCGVTGT